MNVFGRRQGLLGCDMDMDTYEEYRARRMARIADMVELRRAGKTLEEIATIYGISRARVWQLTAKHYRRYMTWMKADTNP
jgi:DNA-directed RNA polymerase sigma subunit (sigma70/sigma32)